MVAALLGVLGVTEKGVSDSPVGIRPRGTLWVTTIDGEDSA